MSEAQTVEISLTQVGDYEFNVRFDGTAIGELATDEPPPLGQGHGPNPSRLLATAVANCLAASLLFALRKFGNTPAPLTAKARATIARNAGGRWRVPRIEVDLQLADAADSLDHLDRVLAQFEDFCVVTGSVRQGVEVDVRVLDPAGVALPLRADR
ncbi:OsmC family protein [Frateuria soli]|uniref:OsmC family protein n=1 Tax=Frateuria soli TaxID=1542730 RepID=UPI001E4D2D4D|nr:OsmC family protein [Frateuria soli]UGB39593.1 OsmC family protein [Frateuria soli]